MNSNQFTIKPKTRLPYFLLAFYLVILFGILATLTDLPTFKIYWPVAIIALLGIFFQLKKITKRIIFDFDLKKVFIKDFISTKTIEADEILSIQKVQSITKGDWFGIQLKRDPFGMPIQISFPPKITTNIQAHATKFERETLPKLNEILK